MSGRLFGIELQRARERGGMSVEAAATAAGIPADLWRALEAEDSSRFSITPVAYVTAAAAVRTKWTLVSV